MENGLLVDRLSNLPWELLDKILGCLPTDVVAKMSVLSRRWKNNWKYVSSVILSGGKSPRVVYHVLLSHHGNIERLKLSRLYGCLQKEDIICWLNFLRGSGSNIKEISIEFHDCMQSLSVTNGFSNLVTLTLSNFTADAVVLESLFGGCPLLESLKLLNFRIWECLHIQGHMLKSLHIDGNFKDLCIDSHSHLTNVHLNLKFSRGTVGLNEAREEGVANHLVKFLGHISHIKKLSLCGFLLKEWARESKFERQVIQYGNLSVLGLHDVRTDDVVQSSAVCDLLKMLPNVKELFINLLAPDPSCSMFGRTSHQEVHLSNLDLHFNQLKFAKIEKNFSDSRADCFLGRALIVEILKSSPALKGMVVKGFSCDTSYMREILSTPRASKDLLFKYFCNKCSVNM